MPTKHPIATWTLLGLILATAFLVTGFLPGQSDLEPVQVSRDTLADGQWWRLLTSMFAHAGPLHLGFNAIALLSMSELERRMGSARFTLVYLASGIGGGIAHVMTSDIPAVGASGAIFGLLGVILVLSPRMELSVLGLPMPAILALTLYLSVVLLVPAFSTALPIAHWAHLGGMFVGMAAGLTIDPHQGVTHLLYIGLVFVGTLALVSALTGISWGELPRILDAEGIPGLLAETWLVWLSLAAIYIVLYALKREGAQEGEREPVQ